MLYFFYNYLSIILAIKILFKTKYTLLIYCLESKRLEKCLFLENEKCKILKWEMGNVLHVVEEFVLPSSYRLLFLPYILNLTYIFPNYLHISFSKTFGCHFVIGHYVK